jgi:hypothetical protein
MPCTRPLLCAAMLASVLSETRGQCDHWLLSPSRHATFRGGGDALAIYTPPGASAARPVVGGSGLRYNDTELHNIAQWDGSDWVSLGSGLNYQADALTAWDSAAGPRLVAGGPFTIAGGVSVAAIATWDGAAWHAMGSGLVDQGGGNGEVLALTTWDPDGPGPAAAQVVAAGDFASAGGNSANHIATWDGSAWHALRTGLDGIVWALTSWDPDGAGPVVPQIVAGGDFVTAGGGAVNHIARWDGIAWRPLGTGLSSTNGTVFVNDLISWDPDGPGPQNPVLVVCGLFTHAGGVPAAGVAYWDGAWHAMATAPGTSVDSLGTWAPDGAGPQPAQLVASHVGYDVGIWNGSSWQPLGRFNDAAGVVHFGTWDPDGPGPLGPRLVGGGLLAGNTPTGFASGAMQLVGDEWHTFGAAPTGYAATVFGGQLVTGGQFEMITDGGTSPTPDAFNLAQWDGSAITTVGVNTSSVTGPVRAMSTFDIGGHSASSNLLVGGAFGAAGGIMASNIVQYVAGSLFFQNRWYPLGSGVNATVYAVERFNGNTYAGGDFTATGDNSVALSRIGCWTGSAWQPLGSGLNGTCYALKSYNGALYAAGAFTLADGRTASRLARWNGAAWTGYGVFRTGPVYAMEVYNGNLIIGGSFAGPENHLCVYDGSSFSALGGGADATVRSLCVGPDGLLYAGGDFTSVGGVPVNHVARWNGSVWSDVQGGTDGPVYALRGFRNEVHAFGAFGQSASSTIASPGWARFSLDGVPWIVHQPTDVSGVCVGGRGHIPFTPAADYIPWAFTWRHNGVPVSMGTTPWGSTLAQGFWGLHIENAAPQDSGMYDVTVSTDCGSVTSDPATFSVCAVDMNCDGRITVDDFLAFLGFFAAGNHRADFDLNGSVTVQDLLAFLAQYAAGC